MDEEEVDTSFITWVFQVPFPIGFIVQGKVVHFDRILFAGMKRRVL